MKIVILLLALIGISISSYCSGRAYEPITCIKSEAEISDNKCCYIIISKSDYSYYEIGYCFEFPKEMNGEEIIRKYGYYKVICNEKILKTKLLLSLLLLFLFFK